LGTYLTLPEEIEKEIVILKTFVCEQVSNLTNKVSNEVALTAIVDTSTVVGNVAAVEVAQGILKGSITIPLTSCLTGLD
jgi:hypothetical protein